MTTDDVYKLKVLLQLNGYILDEMAGLLRYSSGKAIFYVYPNGEVVASAGLSIAGAMRVITFEQGVALLNSEEYP